MGRMSDTRLKLSWGFDPNAATVVEKAPDMAASQALLLNKKLDEVGAVEQITDENLNLSL